MPETKFVNFDTKYKVVNGDNSMTIFMQRAIEFANVLDSDVNLTPNVEFINNKQVISGELVMTTKNSLRDIDAFIDNNTGDLIISTEDSKNYTLNDQGDLIYTYR